MIDPVIGDKVDKLTGYRFPGTIVAVFVTLTNKLRVVVEMDDTHILHIFDPNQLTRR